MKMTFVRSVSRPCCTAKVFVMALLLFPFGLRAADYYWVGGTGVWNDLNHWATSSGGVIKHTIVPSVLDNAIFDANSFSGAGQSVTLNQEAFCKDFKWDNVTNTPSFTGAGYNLNVAGNYIVLGTPFTFNHVNGNLAISGYFLVDGSNMSFTKNGGTFTVGAAFDIKNVATMAFSTNTTISITSGNMTFTDATLTAFTSGGISITTGNLLFSNAKTTGAFSGGNVNLSNGFIDIPNWSGGNFSFGTVTVSSNFTMSGWTGAGNFSCGNITSSSGSFTVSNWAAGTMALGYMNLTVGSISFSNWTVVKNITNNGFAIGGNFTLSNCTAGWTFLTQSNHCSLSGNFLIDNAPITFNQTHNLAVGGNFSVLNGATAFNHGSVLTVSKSFTLNAAMTFNQSNYVIFNTNLAGQTITSAGKSFGYVRFNGSGVGEWILQDNFKATANTEHYTGIFRSNGKAVDYGQNFNAVDGGSVKTLDYTGTDTVRVQYQFRVSTSGSTILTMSSAVLKLHTVNWSEMYIDGGGKTFGTVVINHLYNTNSYTNIRFRDNNSVYGNVYMTINNGSRLYKEGSNNTFGNVSINYINAAVTSTDWNYIFGTNTFGNFTISSNGLKPWFYCEQNNTFGQVTLAAGTEWQIAQTRIQTLTGLMATGNCLKFINIYSSNSAVAATITDSNGGANALDFVKLTAISFTGAGVTWTATNVLDYGNNSGIAITPLGSQTYYWIGGAGNWSDPAHWSLASGGATAGCVPVDVDHAVFDNNSFTGSDQTVTLNVAATITDMSWTAGVTGGPNFNGSQNLVLNGNLTVAGVMDWNLTGALTLRKSLALNAGMTWNQTGNFTFSGTTAGNTIHLAGKTFASHVYFDNPGSTASGTWTLAADFTVAQSKAVVFSDATFISAGFKVDFGDYLDATANVVKVLDFTGTDTVRVKRQWQMLNSTSATLTMGTAVLLLRQPAAEGNNMILDGGGKTYHDVVFDARQTNGSYTLYIRNNSMTFRDVYFRISGAQPVRIEGGGYVFRDVYANFLSSNTGYAPNFEVFNNHSFASLQFNNPSVQPKLYLYGSNSITTLQLYHGMDVFFGHNQTQTLQSITATSLCTRLIDMASTSGGTQATLSDASGTNSLDFVSLKDLKVQGGATWNASNVVNNGNNTGWNITVAPPVTYYWIGGTGNWNDGAHWALSSGGTAAGCSPNPQDNVVFDINSFTGTGQSVNLVSNTKCRNMSWTAGVTQNPTFQGNFELDIEGDLKVLGTMTWVQNNSLYPRGDFILNAGVTWSHDHYLLFDSDSTNNIVNPGGKTFRHLVRFDAKTTGSGPKWTLAGDYKLLNTSTSFVTYVYEGTFTTAGYEVDAGYQFRAYDGTDLRSINLSGTDTIRMRQGWLVTTNANTTLTIGGATILLKTNQNENQQFYGGNRVYKDVVVSHGSSNNGRYMQFLDNNTFEDIWVSFPTVGHQAVYFDNQQNVQSLRVDRYTDYNLELFYRNGPHTFGSIDVNVLGNGPSYHYFQNSAHQFGNYDVQSANGLANFYFQSANNQFQDVVVTTTTTGTAYLQMEQNASFAKLDLPKGFDMFVYAGRTQTIGTFIPRSTCLVRSKIRGQNATTSVISQASGVVTTEWITLENHTVQGGAAFSATDITQVGTINGWTAVPIQPITLFWVGGTGNWSDANHWAYVSGGPGNGCLIPGAVDHAVFDPNSFTATGQTVTMNVTGQCKNMIWNNVAFSPTFFQNGNSQNLTVYGDLVVNSPMSWNWTNSGNSILYLKGSVTIASSVTWNHNKEVRFEPASGSHTINMGGKTFLNNLRFTGAVGAKWTLQNNFTVNTGFSTFLAQGEFYSNGFAVDFGLAFDFNNANTKKMDFSGTATVKVRRDWIGNGTGTTFVSGGAAILLESSIAENMSFTGGNITTYGDLTVRHLNANNQTITFSGNNTFGDVNFEYTNRKDITINGNNTFSGFTITQDYSVTSNIPQHAFNGTNSFSSFVILSLGVQGPEIAFAQNNTFGNLISAGRGTRLKFGSAKTQTINGELLILGTGGQPIFFNSTTAGTQATISKATGDVCLDFVWIKDINATGGATFNAGVNGANLGNNSGINFMTACAAYYWIGGSGNWTDLNHWATSSGGSTLHTQLPTEIDDVYFDANSFSATGQTVTFNDPNAECRNMNWFSALYQPTLTGSATDLDLSGSLTLTPFMTQNWTGTWNFVAQSGLPTIDTKGKALQNMQINTLTGAVQLSLLNDLKINNDLILTKGIFQTQGNNIETKNFNLVGAEERTLQLGASQVTITNGKWDVQDVTNLTITPGSSKIVVQSEGASAHFYGGGKTYNDLRFHTNSTMSSTLTGSNTFNQFKVEPGVTLSIDAGSTQTVTDPVISGTCNKLLTIKSTVSGTQANISKASGTVNASFLVLQDINATGGATFNASQATDNGGNTGWNFIVVPQLQVTVSVTDATCPTPNNGTTAAVVTGGVTPFAYLWNTIETTQTLSNLSQGSYTVTVTDGAGCVASATGTVSQPASYNFAATATGGMVCFGLSNGMVSVTPSGAQTPISYLWSNAATTASVPNLAPGTFTVTVTDGANCRAIRTVVIGERPDINANLSVNSSRCLNAPVSFSGSGVGVGLQYAWDFGDAGSGSGQNTSHTFTAPNTYTVQVAISDENNCSDLATQVLTITAPPALAAMTSTNASCLNVCDGVVTLTPSSGLTPYALGNYEFVHTFDGTVLNTAIFSRDNLAAYTQNNTLSMTHAVSAWDKYLYTNQTFARAAGKEFTFAYYHPASTSSMIGWHGNSTGNSNRYVDMLYAFYFNGNSTLNIYEDGSDRGNYTAQVPGGYTTDTWYECKIVLKSTGADYYLRKQGNSNYALIYSSTYSTETALRPGLTYAGTGTAITDNWQVGVSNPAVAGVCPGTYQFVVTDANYCTATASATVAVGDATPPVLNCPGNQTINATAGNCNATATIAAPGFSDNCSILSNVLDFDGTNDYITIPGSFNSNFSGNRITVEGWVYNASGYTPNNCMLAGESFLGDNTIRFAVYLANGNIYAGTYPNNLTGVSAALPTNSWVHFAGTYDGTAIRLYLNGTQVSSANTTLNVGNEEWRIGRRWDNADYFKGKLDEVRIWNVARTAAELNANKNQQISPQAGLVAYYRFNQGVAGGNNTAITLATDGSGNSINGTLQNFARTGSTSNFVLDNPNLSTASPFNSFNATSNASGTYPLGTTTVTWSLTDLNNNTGTCAHTVTVLEPTPPTLTCPANQTLPLNVAHEATLPDYSGLAVASDNCPGAVQLVQSPAAGGTVTGTTPVTLTFTATDVSGNTTACMFTVTGTEPIMSVEGNGLPIANGDNMPDPADHTDFGQATGPTTTRTFTIKNTGNGALSIGAGAITFTGPDAALFSVSNVSLPATVSGPSGSLNFDVVYTPVALGVHTATVNIANNDPGDNPYTFDVTAELDCIAPTFSACPATTVNLNTDAGQCSAVANYTVVATGIPAPALSYALSGATSDNGTGTGSGSTFAKGSTTVTVTATNFCGAPQCVFTVQVTDNELPGITCPGNIAVNTSPGLCTAAVTVPQPTTTDNCLVISGPGKALQFDGGGEYVKLPSINGIKSVTMWVYMSGPWYILDARSGLPNGYLYHNGIGSGWSKMYVNGVNVPVLYSNIPTGQWVHLYLESNVTFNDDINLMSNSSNTETRTGQLDEVGIWSRTFTPAEITTLMSATLNAGAANLLACYNFNEPNGSVTLTDHTGNGRHGTLFNHEAGDWINSTIPLTVTSNLVLLNNVNNTANASGTYPKGVTTITWSVTDASNNTNSCQQTITVTDAQAPTLANPGNQSFNVIASTCAANYSIADPVSDNCTGATWGYTLTGATTASVTGIADGTGSGVISFNKGVTTVTLSATDAASNAATQTSFTVTVTDTELPTISCPAAISRNNDAGQCNAFVTVPEPTVSDNCSGSGNALHFDGVDDLVVIPDANNLDPSNGNFTLECWFKTTTGGTLASKYGWPAPVNNEGANYALGVNTSTKIPFLLLRDNPSGGSGTQSLSGTSFVGDGCWHHVAMVVDQTNDLLYFYVDGVLENSATLTETGNIDSANPLVIGAQENATGVGYINQFTGMVDELRVWQTVRTASEITAGLYGVSPASPGLQAYYTFDQGTAGSSNGGVTTLTDAAGADNNGALSGFALNGNTSNWVRGQFDLHVTNNFNGSCNASGTYPVGLTTVVWTLTDASGNTKSCQHTVTVTDNQAPTLAHPGNQSFNVIASTCAANYSIADPVSDNCTGATWGYTLTGATTGTVSGLADGTGSGAISFNKGVTTVTLSATDAASNAAAQTSFTVTVTDNEKPQITCAGPVVINTTVGQCTGMTTLAEPLVTDNCTLPGNALDFDGTDDYIEAGTGLATLDNFTLETWVYYRGGAQWLLNFTNGSAERVGLEINLGQLWTHNNRPGFPIVSFGGGTINTNQWYHVAYTNDNVTGKKLYINGVLVASNASTISPVQLTGPVHFNIGRIYNSPYFFNGKMDEVRVWSVARTQAEIQANMNSELAAQAGLAAIYHFNQGAAGGNNAGVNTATDHSGNAHTGTLNGFALNGAASNWICGATGSCLTSNAPATYPKGNTVVTWTATDASGNTQTCQQTVTVTDNEAPTLTVPAANIPLNVIASTCAANYTIADPVSDNCTGATWGYTLTGATTGTVSGLADGTGSGVISFNKGVTTVTLDGVDAATNAALQKTFTVTVIDNQPPTISCPANQTLPPTQTSPCAALVSGIDASYSDNCTSSTSLSYTLSGATTGSGNGQASGQTLLVGTTTVTYSVSDGSTPATSCAFTVTVTNCNIEFAGTIKWSNNLSQGVNNATVNLSGAGTGNDMSDTNGDYLVSVPYTTGNFTLKPVKNINRLNGVTVADAIAIQQHLALTAPFTTAYQYIAGDVNRSNSISTLDANLINQSLLGNASANNIFNVYWRFVPTTHTLSLPPWGFPEQISLTSVSTNQSGKDFIGVKVGDVVSTWANPMNFGPTDPLRWKVQDQALTAGRTVTAEFRADAFADLAAWQFALQFDPTRLQLDSIEALGALPLTAGQFGVARASAGEIRSVWSRMPGADLGAGAEVFRLRFRVLQTGGWLSEALALGPDILMAEAYRSDLRPAPVELEFWQATGTQEADPHRVLLLQNRPNPFEGKTTIGFVLPEACEAQLRVLDATGRLVYSHQAWYPAGKQEEVFEWNGASGVLYYELTTPYGRLTRKMVSTRE